MSYWECPNCGKEHHYGNTGVLDDYDGKGKVWFTCDCGSEFQMWVDYDPSFVVDRASIKLPAKDEAL